MWLVTKKCRPEDTFQALVYGPAPDDEEHCEGGQKAGQHNCICGVIVAVLALCKDDPDDDQHRCPQAMEHRGEEAQHGDIIGSEGPPPPQHLHCRHFCLMPVLDQAAAVLQLHELPAQIVPHYSRAT
jgi:hypothetical protein